MEQKEDIQKASYGKKVSPIAIAKEYLVAELSKIFSEDNLQSGLELGIDKLSEKEVWRLLEALSFTYRLNGVFWIIGNDSYDWYKENINCGELVLTGMNPKIDKVTNSENIKNNPLKFRDYLIEYFKKNPNSDPEGLGQFRPRNQKIKYPTVILTVKDEKYYLLDGSNRLIAHLMAGNDTITAYVGRKSKVGKMKIGDSTFWLLRTLYGKVDKKSKSKVLAITKELAKLSSDGNDAIITYWIAYAQDEKLKEVGKKLISDLNESKLTLSDQGKRQK